MSKIDHEYTKEIVCPYCGNEETDSWEFSDDGIHECSVCDNEFSYERILTVEYSTSKKECFKHALVLREDFHKFIYDTEAVFEPTYHRVPLPESEWRYYKCMVCSVCDKEVQVQLSIDEYNSL
jgi:transcription elongation factor Elf1